MPWKSHKSKLVKLWVTIVVICAMMVLCIAMSVISLVLILNLKTDIDIAEPLDTHEPQQEYTEEPENHTYAENHTHPFESHTHPPPTSPAPTHERVLFCYGSKTILKGKDTSRTKVPLEVSLYDSGKYFQTDNSFHAPYKGIYAFSFGAVTRNYKDLDVYLYTQETGGPLKAIARIYEDLKDKGKNEYSSGSASIIIPLDKGDKVSLWLANKTDAQINGNANGGNGTPSTLFSGELLQLLT